MTAPAKQSGRIVRLAETGRKQVPFTLDGVDYSAFAGDSVLTAVLSAGPVLRWSEFGPEGRAGFCLMGACQDCWIWTEEGLRLRSCSTSIAPKMRLLTKAPKVWP